MLSFENGIFSNELKTVNFFPKQYTYLIRFAIKNCSFSSKADLISISDCKIEELKNSRLVNLQILQQLFEIFFNLQIQKRIV